jgi:hypothetical protein
MVLCLSAMSAAAYAQGMDMNLDVDVDEHHGHRGHTEEVDMHMGMPGAQMNMKVKVKQDTRHMREDRHDRDDRHDRRRDRDRSSLGRDCGTGEDSGCTMKRNGKYPMDAEEFRGLLHALKTNDNEISRFEIAEAALRSSLLTAKQLGPILELFENEIYRFDVAKIAAPRLVNPSHALGHSSKFHNSIYAADYTKLMTSQR